MEIWKAVIVGVVQGLAEFLPISSSGHIVITEFLLGIRQIGVAPPEDLAFEVMLHMGTLLSVLIFYRKRLFNMTLSLFKKDMLDDRRMILFLAIATVPAVIAYELAGDWFKAAYNYPVLVSALLIVTGCVLYVPHLFKNKKTLDDYVGFKGALMMGIGQAFAILPGISRSGSTIASGIVAGVNPAKVAEFSFLMSIPAIAGGMVFAIKDRAEEFQAAGAATVDAYQQSILSCLTPAYLWGAFAAAVVGLVAIYMVLTAIKKGKLEVFSWYCFAAGISGVIYFAIQQGGLFS